MSCKARNRPAYTKRHDVITLRMLEFKFQSCVDEEAGKKRSLSIRRLKLFPLGSMEKERDFASRSVKIQ